ncbi:Zn-ribbon domain-containing OB-fold protein [Halomonas sp. HK25]|uniref:Zn-ribbon domain-containing OB-fold protein n=1 Tax=Halomonas sp. HK25 TaxID=3394321 RepID=UPI0039FCB3C7
MNTELPEPVANGDSRPYWDAAQEGRLVLRRCKDCGELHFMPRYLCPFCWSEQLEWVDSKGRGTVHSFSIIRRAPSPVFAQQVPYVTALIDLDEGPRMVANVLGENSLSVSIGDRVSVTFGSRGDDTLIPQFTLDDEAGT